MLAQQYGMEVLDLNSYEIPPEILECLTPEVASRYKVVPVMKHDDVLTIAMSDPTDMETLDALRYLLGTEVDAMVASKSQIDAILDRHYRTGADSVEGYLQEMTEDADLDTELVSNIGQAESLDDENAPIIRLVTQLIIDAFKMKASDIHLEPMEKRYRVRYRIDGAAPRGRRTAEIHAGELHQPREDHGAARHHRETDSAGRSHPGHRRRPRHRLARIVGADRSRRIDRHAYSR